MIDTENFEKDLDDRQLRVVNYLRASQHLDHFRPKHILDLVLAYINRKAKRLRPAVLLFSCGAAGGDEDIALPAAAGVEVVHTWTLTHDDLIDHDATRRGEPTVHVLASNKARMEFNYDAEASGEYGERVAILVGDAQHAWSVALFLQTPSPPVNPSVVTRIIQLLESQAVLDLIWGETLDIQYEKVDIADLSEEDIVKMLWLKTGVLYRFSAMAGAMLGLNCSDPDHPVVQALANFASNCGTAFQLQDDILGIVGDEKKLGKPVGSDIREGKRTTILQYSLANASPSERDKLNTVLGHPSASASDIQEVTQLLVDLGGKSYTEQLARKYINEAIPYLDIIPSSKYRDLLHAWAQYMVERTF